MHGLKQIGTICFAIFSLIFSAPIFATNPDINTATASCNDGVFNSNTGPVDIEVNWEPNEIALHWYNGNTELIVDSASQSCVYDDSLTPPAPPERTGYTFKGWRVRDIPDGYTRLEYLQSSGTQYINTGVTLLSDNVTYEWNAKDNSSGSGTSLFSAEYSINGTRTFSGVLYGSKNSRGAWLGSSQSVSMGYSSSDGLFHSWSFVIKSDHTAHLVKDGGALSTISWSGTLNKSNTIAIYCNHATNSFSQQASVAYKYFRIIDNDEVVFNGIPAKRNSDNVLGMWDTVSKTFFTNAGSGTFIAGPVVQ